MIGKAGEIRLRDWNPESSEFSNSDGEYKVTKFEAELSLFVEHFLEEVARHHTDAGKAWDREFWSDG